MFKLHYSDPKAVTLGSIAALAVWKASNFAVDPGHLSMVATAAVTGIAAPEKGFGRADVEQESHIVTPYVNNVEEE
jgi:hypothetical protein